MRDATHIEHIEKWARYVKSNSDWKSTHTRFINAQFQKAYGFIERLSEEKGGKEKLAKLYRIKNKDGYKKLFG